MWDDATFFATLFGLFCHQDPATLLLIEGSYVEMCPRCIGLHAGFALSMLVTSQMAFPKRASNTAIQLGVLVLALNTAVVHWLLGAMQWMEMTASLRIITGSISGGAFAILFGVYRNERVFQRESILPDTRYVVVLLSGVTLTVYATVSLASWMFVNLTILTLLLLNLFIVMQCFIRIVQRFLSSQPYEEKDYDTGTEKNLH